MKELTLITIPTYVKSVKIIVLLVLTMTYVSHVYKDTFLAIVSASCVMKDVLHALLKPLTAPSVKGVNSLSLMPHALTHAPILHLLILTLISKDVLNVHQTAKLALVLGKTNV